MFIKVEKMINISKANLEKDIQDGMKRDGIIEKYSTDTVKLTNSDVTKILKATGLKIRKFQRPKFAIVNDAELPLDPTIAREVKVEAEKGNSDLTGLLSNNSVNN